MANNINAALMRADLAKLPLWSGDVSKDGYTIEQWVTRVNKAAATAAWSDEDTMAYVYNALRGPALRWLESLKRFNVNIDSWAAVRTEMLDAYSRVQTARTADRFNGNNSRRRGYKGRRGGGSRKISGQGGTNASPPLRRVTPTNIAGAHAHGASSGKTSVH
jgi:hypothetical protein